MGRLVFIVSGVVVAALGVWFVVARWDDANKVAVVVSALAAVAAVGVSVWAAVRTPSSGKSLTVTDTGHAVAHSGGQAVTGLSVRASRVDRQVQVERTGDAQASGDGDAVSGAQLD